MATIFTVLFCICSHLELNDQNLYMPYFIILILIENFFFYFSKEHERNREDNFDNLDIYNNMDNPTESRSLTPYGAISGGNNGGNTAQNQTDGRSKLFLQFEFLMIFMQFQQMYLTNQFKIYRFKTQSFAFQIPISETS